MKKFFAYLTLVAAMSSLTIVTGCNTVAGAGKDVERAGDAIHDKAKETQQKM